MKILFLTRKFYPSIGGVERHTLEVAKELVKKVEKVTIVCEEGKRDKGDKGDKRDKGIKVYRIPVTLGAKLKKFQIWRWLWKNRNLIKEADVVHCHDIFFWFLPFRFIFPKKPVYITFHGWEGKFPIPKRYILIRKIWEKLSWGNICIGDYLKKWYGAKTSFITYGGVSLAPPRGSPQATPGVSLSLVFVGRLEKDVGLLIYLKALEQLKRKRINFKVEFYGDGSLRKQAEKYGKVFGFTENIFPKISHAQIIFASSYLVILEALSLGKAVISVFDNRLKGDYLKMSPYFKYIVVASNSNEVAQTILKVTQSLNSVKDIVKSGKEWAIGESWEKVADLYLSLWRGIEKL